MALSMDELAKRVRSALEGGDLDGYQELLAPDVSWGPPDDPEWGCHNRSQVLAWYKAARDSGMRARVDDVVVGSQALLVALTVSGRDEPDGSGAPARRWQVLTVKDGLVADIRGYDDADEAAARAGVAG